MKLPFLSAVRLQVTLTDRSTNSKETKDLEVVSGEQIPVDLSEKITISKEGEAPTHIVPSPQGFMVEWADGTLVFLTPSEDVSNDNAPRQVSINDSTFSGGDGELATFMNWQASYEDSPLPWAPLDPYAVPFPESKIEVPLVPVAVVPEPVVTPEPVITPTFFAPPPLIVPPPPDTVPTIGPLSGTGVDEEGLANIPGVSGIPGGPGDLPGEATVTSGAFENFSYGANGPGDVQLVASADTGLRTVGGYVVYSEWDTANHVLTGFADVTINNIVVKVPVFTLTLAEDSSGTPTGDWTFELLRQIIHEPPGPGQESFEDDKLLNVNVIVSDVDGDTVSASFTVTINDDSPEINPAQGRGAPTLTVDETVLPASDSIDLTPQFTSLPGVDSPFQLHFALNVSSPGVDSTFHDTATGNSIFLFLNGSGAVEGRVGVDAATAEVSGIVAFKLSLDDVTHVLKLEQFSAIVHPDDSNPNDQLHLPDASVIAIATITDVDGDSRSASINIGDALIFKDDGPSIHLAGESQVPPVLTTDDTNITDHAGPASFAGLFDGAFGNDGFKDSDHNGVQDADAVKYTLGVSVQNADSGIVDTQTGQAVLLNMDGHDVVGTVNGGATEVFRITVDESTGDVSLIQSRSVVHDDINDASEVGTPAVLSGVDLITLTATITDGDGDHAAVTANIGHAFAFEDDGPSISTVGVPDALIVDETNLALNASANFADNFTSAYGADGAGTVTYALNVAAGPSGLVDTATNQNVLLSLNGGVVEGRTSGTNALVFTVSVDAGGQVTLDQMRAVVHSPDTGPDQNVTLGLANMVTLTGTITDKDGDHQDAVINIGQALNFHDDAPSISTVGVPDALIVDETNLGLNASANFADNFAPVYGADGAGTVTYALNVAAGPSGLVDTATNLAVNLTMNGTTVEGRTAGGGNLLVFTVSVDAGGQVTLDQMRAVVHSPDTGPDQNVTLGLANMVTLTGTITDKDGDHQDAVINIGQALNFHDDAPSISTVGVPDALIVDETNLALNASANFADNFAPVYGADGAGTVTYALNVAAGPSGLVDTATNLAVNLTMNGTTVEGRTAGGGNLLVFTVSVDAGGQVTLDQMRAVVHSPDTGPDQNVTLGLANMVTLTGTITDKDGDHQDAVINIGQALNFHDDAPSISVTAAPDALIVDETNLGLNASANFADNFTSAYGADGAGTVTYALNVAAGPSGLVDTATNLAVNLTMNGTTVEGRTAGGGNLLVFTVSVDAGGQVTLDQMRAVVHSPDTGPDQNVTLGLANMVTLTGTITDKDGDHQDAVINIGQALNFHDDAPSISTVGVPDALIVDETNLGLNASANFADNFAPVYGADGAGTVTYALNVAAGPSGLVDTATNQNVLLSLNGGVVEGRTSGTNALVFTVSVDAGGQVTLDQMRAVVHSPDTGPDQNVTLGLANMVTLTGTITDKDGDHQDAVINIGQALNFHDDAPSISVTAAPDALIVDETNLALNASANFADNFAPVYGADGAGTVTYALNVAAGPSGLVDTATNLAVNLTMNGTTVEGRTAGGGNLLVFTVSVDAGGQVTLDQMRAVVHSPDTGPDQNVTLGLANMVTLTGTITDKDGDHQDAVINIGQALNFHDDAPSISVTAAPDALIVDETNLGLNASANFADNFAPVYGADGAGTVTYALNVAAGPSGLVDTATNLAVNLTMNGTTVEGRTAGGGNLLVFTVSVDAGGQVTLDQMRAVVHSPDTGPDQNVTLGLANMVTLTGTITDKDGDHQDAVINIGQALNFHDDAPSISTVGVPDALIVDETNLAVNASANFADNFAPVYGADGAGTVTYALNVAAGPSGLVDTATNLAVNLTMNGTTVEGRTAGGGNLLVFTVSVDAGGQVTLDQMRAVVHSPDTGPDQNVTLGLANMVTLTGTITDKDGDHQDAVINIGQALNFHDDAPSISTVGVPDALIVDETNLAVNASANFADNFAPVYGADGAGTVTYALNVAAGPSGLVDTATNLAVNLAMNGTTVEGRTAGGGNLLVFTVSVDAGGQVTLDQMRAVVHSPDTGPDQNVTLGLANMVTLTGTITDKDGDHQDAVINIGQALNFHDDAPSISTVGVPDALIVDETNLGLNASANFADNFAPVYGADGAGTVTYALNVAAGPSGLVDTATNLAVNLTMNGTTVEGRTAGGGNLLVFTVSVDAGGQVTLDQMRAVVHSPDTGPDQNVTLGLANMVTLTGTITDKDGDHQDAVINIGQALNFHDDAPSISVTAAPDALIVDETNLGLNASANFADNFTSAYGADGAGTVTYALNVAAGPSGLVDTATNLAVNLTMNGTTVEGRTAGGGNLLVFTVSVDAGGQVTLDQMRAVVHSPDTGPDQNVTLGLANMVTLTGTITDKDGDHQDAVINIGQALNFHDDAPSISTVGVPDALIVDETNLGLNASANFADNFAPVYGADGAGTVTYALNVAAGPSGLVDTATNQNVLLSLNGGVVEGRTSGTNALVFTVSVDAGGQVTLDQMRAVVHSPDTGPDQNVTLGLANMVTLTGTITDKDGDHQDAVINIGQALNFHDDAPSISVTAAPDALIVDETNLALNASANFADNFAPVYGADGAGTVTYALNVAAGPSGLVDTATNLAVNLTMNGTTVEGRTAGGGNLLVFTVSVDAGGQVTLDQMRAVVHSPDTGPDQNVTLGLANMVTLTGTITDKDGDHQDAVINIGQALNFHDDAPSASAVIDSHILDDEGLAGGNVGGTGDAAGILVSTTGSLGYSVGADNLGTLVVSGPGTLGTESVTSSWDSLTNKLTISSLRGALMTVEVTNLATGAYTATLLMPLMHPTVGTEDNIILNLGYTITDKDGDSAIGSLQVTVNDDSPAIVTPPEAIELHLVGSDLTATGDFDYNIGADHHTNFSASNSDFSTINLSGTVGANAITAPVVQWVSENASTAVYNVSFSYQSDPGNPSQTGIATGTLTFDKAAGNYTVTLEPIQGFTIVTTNGTDASDFHEYQIPVGGGGSPEVVVAALGANFFAQFTGFDSGLSAGGNQAYTAGEVFAGAATASVLVSSIAVGVGGNTMQGGELMDIDFFTTDPGNNLAAVADGRASAIFLKFDGVGNTEDVVVMLKLVDELNPLLTTTKAIIVDNGDFFTSAHPAPAPYVISLDSNDAAVIIESNDYNLNPGEHWVISGLQVLTSTEGISGTGIDLNSAIGILGGSTAFQHFESVGALAPVADTTDGSEPMKIVDIGFVITTSTTSSLPADLHFTFNVVDADGDASPAQALSVTIGATPVVLDLDHNGLAFTSLADSHAHFDYNGDGIAEHSAWIGAHDAFLAYDANGDGKVNNGSEISFTHYSPEAHTDLEGLRLAFDTNHDNILSAHDTDFSKFGVWVDANGDGVSDSGEFHSLTDAGITSINLMSDGHSYMAANGDVMVFGEASYTHTDGSIGLVGDVAMATAPLNSDLGQTPIDSSLADNNAVASNLPAIHEVLSTGDTLDHAIGSLADSNPISTADPASSTSPDPASNTSSGLASSTPVDPAPSTPAEQSSVTPEPETTSGGASAVADSGSSSGNTSSAAASSDSSHGADSSTSGGSSTHTDSAVASVPESVAHVDEPPPVIVA